MKKTTLEKGLFNENGYSTLYIEATKKPSRPSTSDFLYDNKIIELFVQYEDDCKDAYLTCLVDNTGHLYQYHDVSSSDRGDIEDLLRLFDIEKNELVKLYHNA